MTAKELLNLIDWLRKQGFEDEKIIECLESVEGQKKILTADDETEQAGEVRQPRTAEKEEL